MKRYETLILTVPHITSDETTGLETEVSKIIKKNTGSLVSFERWGKMKLAYPVRKNDYGVYFLVRFDVDSQKENDIVTDVRSLFAVKFNNFVMRHMNSALDINAPLEYQRPESLEETPTRDVDTFLRQNNMEGLRSSAAPVSAEADVDLDQDVE